MKLQISLEFILVFAFVITIFIVIFSLIAARGSQLSSEEVYGQVQLVAQTIAQQVNTAFSSGNGYSANIVLQSGYGINLYNITILPNGEIVVTAQEGSQKIQSIAFSEAKDIILANTISTNSMTIQNFFGGICIDINCPSPANYSRTISVTTQTIQDAKFNGIDSYINTGSEGESFYSGARSYWVWECLNVPAIYPGSARWVAVSTGGFTLEALPTNHLCPTLAGSPGWWNFWGIEYSAGASYYDLYADGSLYYGSPMGPLSYGPGPDYSTIGWTSYGSSAAPNWWQGYLADVQIYNTTLTQAQANVLYAEGIDGAPVLPANIVGWYPLNGNTNDYSGNNNTASAFDITYATVSMINTKVSGYYGTPLDGVLIGLASNQANYTGIQPAITTTYTNLQGIGTAFLSVNVSTGIQGVNISVYPGSLADQGNLIGWWPLDRAFVARNRSTNLLFDIGGNGYSGTGYTGIGTNVVEASNTVSGIGGLLFNGVNSLAEVPVYGPAYIMPQTTGITMSMSLYLNSTLGSNSIVLLAPSGNQCGYKLLITYNSLQGSDNCGHYYTGSYSFAKGVLYNLAVSVASGSNPNETYYVNGIQVAKGKSTVWTSGSSYSDICIGSFCGTNTLQGVITNLQLYQTALSNSQIYQLYASPTPTANVTTPLTYGT